MHGSRKRKLHEKTEQKRLSFTFLSRDLLLITITGRIIIINKLEFCFKASNHRMKIK
jgi:hypothetical protein